MPLTSCYYYGQPFGLHDATSYDKINNKIYAVFYQGTTYNNGSLSLYVFDPPTYTWTFICNLLANVTISVAYVSICYYNNKIYYTYADIDNAYIHDLAGAPGNYTTTNTMYTIGYYHINPFNSFVSTGTGYLYCMNDKLSSANNYPSFKRYQVSTNSWTELSPGFYSCGDVRQVIEYDARLNVIYYLAMDSTYRWVQRYISSENRWETQYFDLYRISTDTSNISMSFYDNKLFFCNSANGRKVYVLDLITNILTYIDTDFQLNNNLSIYCIGVAPIDSVNTFSLIAFNCYNSIYNTRSYNTFNSFTEIPDTTVINTGVGTYTTPIIALDDPFKSSYFKIDSDTDPGVTSVSKDSTLQDGTIEVRSSATAPLAIDEIFWFVSMDAHFNHVYRYNIQNNSWDYVYYQGTHYYYYEYTAFGSAIDRRSGRMLVHSHAYDYGTVTSIFDTRTMATVYSLWGYYSNYAEAIESHFDAERGFWSYFIDHYSAQGYGLHFVHALANMSIIGTYYAANMYSFCAELDGTGIWYVDQDVMALIHIDSTGNLLKTIPLGSPMGVCGTEDNGCWVVDMADPAAGKVIKRYSYTGELLQTIKVDKDLRKMSSDNKDGFYVLTTTSIGEVWHYDKAGVRDMVATGIFDESKLDGGYNGVVLYSDTLRRTRYLDFKSKTILWSKSYPNDIWNGSWQHCSMPVIFSRTVESDALFNSSYGGVPMLPQAIDQVWYGNTNLEWVEVPKDGYFLPKQMYHQARITLRNTDTVSTPIVYKIAMAPAEKITDIHPKTSKPIFIRSDIPSSASFSQFDARLKVWWDVEEGN